MILNMRVAAQEAGTAKEAVEYAAREANGSGLQHFAGGDSVSVGGILLIVLLVVLIWWLLHDGGH